MILWMIKMSEKVVPLRDNLETIAAEITNNHPKATAFVVIAFERGDASDVWIYHKANIQELSFASVRLAHLVNRDCI